MNDLPVDIQAVRAAAARRLPSFVFDFIDGGAGTERAVAGNRRALDEITLTPRAMVDVSRRSLCTTLFGAPASMPVVVAPTGLNGLLWPDGDIALARAAARASATRQGKPWFTHRTLPHGASSGCCQCWLGRQRPWCAQSVAATATESASGSDRLGLGVDNTSADMLLNK